MPLAYGLLGWAIKRKMEQAKAKKQEKEQQVTDIRALADTLGLKDVPNEQLQTIGPQGVLRLGIQTMKTKREAKAKKEKETTERRSQVDVLSNAMRGSRVFPALGRTEGQPTEASEAEVDRFNLMGRSRDTISKGGPTPFTMEQILKMAKRETPKAEFTSEQRWQHNMTTMKFSYQKWKDIRNFALEAKDKRAAAIATEIDDLGRKLFGGIMGLIQYDDEKARREDMKRYDELMTDYEALSKGRYERATEGAASPAPEPKKPTAIPKITDTFISKIETDIREKQKAGLLGGSQKELDAYLWKTYRIHWDDLQ